MSATGADGRLSPALLVADSWLSVDGRVLRLEWHRERFIRSAALQGQDADAAGDAFDAFTATVPRQGTWWPRINLYDDGEVSGELRPAPERGGWVALWTAPDDPRRVPTIKGPDLAAMQALRAVAALHGADEAVLLHHGQICEGAMSSIVWWMEEMLWVPSASMPTVDSVTRRWLVEQAAEYDIEVMELDSPPRGVKGLEVWSLSALHGIRPVARWIDGPWVARGTTHRFWQQLLEDSRR